MQAAGIFFARRVDERTANAAGPPPAFRGANVLIDGPLRETVAEVRFSGGGGDPVGINEDGIATAFALPGEDDDLTLFGKSREGISGAAVAGSGGIVVAAMVEVDLAKSLPGAAIILLNGHVQRIASTIHSDAFVLRRQFAVVPGQNEPSIAMTEQIRRPGRGAEACGSSG